MPITSRVPKKARQLRAIVVLLLLAGGAVSLWPSVERHLRATDVLARALPHAKDGLARWASHAVHERPCSVAGIARCRLYVPQGVSDPPGLVFVHGAHPKGIDEPRIRRFVRSMSAAGVTVCTPELPELVRYRVTKATLPSIARATQALADELGTARVGLMGISFAGGLVLLTAARPELARHIGAVITLGAYHDLSRLAAFYAGHAVQAPDGANHQSAPARFGLLAMFHAHAETYFEARDRELARRVLWAELNGERMPGSAWQALTFNAQETLIRMLGEPATAASLLLEGVAELGDELREVSPRGRLSELRAPTFLLHGRYDPVIPALETQWLAQEVPPEALRSVLITPVFRHADGTPQSLRELWSVVRFTAQVLAALEAP